MVRKLMTGLAGVLMLALGLQTVGAKSKEALGGTVTSAQEGKMEGVVVSARAEGSIKTISVVSDAKGHYSFPATHVAPGKYTLKIRAAGYDLTSANTVDVTAGKGATLDLKLDAAKDPSTQLTSADWLNVMGGTEAQKFSAQKVAVSCTYCHSLERILKSKHNADQFVAVINRMQDYFGDGSMVSTEGRGRAKVLSQAEKDGNHKNPNWGFYPPTDKKKLGEYFASVNQSGGRALPKAVASLPRPKGKETKVIITTWDQPRKDTVSHDSDVDQQGRLWYTDQSDYYLGYLDPKTDTFKEWPLPKAQHHEFGGGSDVQVGLDGTIYTVVTHDDAQGHFGLPYYFDPKTEKGGWMTVPPKTGFGQFIAMDKAGFIYVGEGKFDPKTRSLVDRYPWRDDKSLPKGMHYGYEAGVDSQANWHITDFSANLIVRVDAKTKAVSLHEVPTKDSMPRRGRMDNQDRFWFGEYFGDKIAMFDAKTKTFKEWATPKWTAPYTSSVPNKKGHVFAPSNSSDRVFRLDPKTGEILAYLMPTMNFDTKEVSIDPISGTAAIFANTRNAQIVRVEPID